MIRALVTLAALYATTAATLVVAACIIRARENARHRTVRRIKGLDRLIARETARVQLLDQLIEAEDFDLWAIELGTDLPVIDIEEWWM